MKEKESHRIIGHYIVSAKIRLEKPLQIASGSDDKASKDALLYYPNVDSKGVPYIPASSFVGALYHYYQKTYKHKPSEDFSKYIWGTDAADNNFASQSHFLPEDMFTFDDYTITIRDGVKIDPKTGTAQEGGKYDYEILEPGIHFYFKAEIKLREGISFEDAENFIAFIQTALKGGELQLGGNKNNGFGYFSCSEFTAYKFDFTKKNGSNSGHYFSYLEKLHEFKKRNLDYYQCKPAEELLVDLPDIELEKPLEFKIEARFKINSTLIIGSDNIDIESDKTHLQSNGKNILSGKSIRGVVLRKIREINEVLEHDFKLNDNELVDFFGSSGNQNSEERKRAIKSKLRIEESTLNSAISAFEQTRIKINRFTGGTIGGLLFQASPLQASDKSEGFDFVLNFSIRKPSKKEKFVLMMVLKELWNGNLPIGGEKGIGRGVLTGVTANVADGEKTYELPKDNKELNKVFHGKES